MRSAASRLFSLIVLLSLGVALVGCGGTTYPTQTVTITPSGALTIDQGQAVTLTAAVSNDLPSFAGVNWTLSGSGTLSGNTTTTAVYTAPSTVTTQTTGTLTASSISSGPGTNATKTITVNPPVKTTTTTLAAGQATVAYNTTLTATGGTGTLTWTVATGTLPTGINLSSAGVLSGTVTAPSSTTLTFRVTDSSSAGATSATTPSLTLTFAPFVLSITTTTLPNVVINTAYSATLASNGGVAPITWSATGLTGTGLSLSSAGVLSGTPTTAGPISLNVTATDSTVSPNTQTATATLGLTVQPLLSITTTTLPTATVGVAYTGSLAVTGGVSPYTWTAPGGLPLGLSLNASTGAITGTPTLPVAGARTVGGNTVYSNSSYTITAKDSGTPQQTANASLGLTVNAGTPTVSTTTLPAASVNVLYSFTLGSSSAGQPGSATWAITTGSAALTTAGFSLNTSTGVITGTATSTAGSPISIGVTVTYNSVTSATQNLSLSVLTGPQITTSTLAPAYVGTAYSATLNATGGSGSNVWSVTSGASTLSTIGLTLTGNGNTATLAGTPTTAMTGSVTFQVKDSNNAVGTAALNVGAYNALSLPSSNPNTLPGGSTTGAYTGSIVVTGAGVGPSYTWTVNSTQLTNNTPLAITGGAVTGLSVQTTGNGTLNVTGTPVGTGTVTLNVSVKDGANTTVTGTYTIAVSTTYTISGTISTNNMCGGGSALSGVTVTLGGTSTATTTTDVNGGYSFPGLANSGTYTVTPSITGPSSAFLPSVRNVTINGSNVGQRNFLVSLGYTVSGTTSYSGSKATQRVYLTLNNNSCNGNNNSNQGTSLSANGAFTIRGVPPGAYTLQAFTDTVGQGASNANSPAGTASVTVSNANVTNANVTLTDPTAPVLSAAQGQIQAGSGFSGGAVMIYSPLTANNNETATSYTLEWSTTQNFTAVAGTKVLPAIGTGDVKVWIVTSLTNGTPYYFRYRGTNGTTTSLNSAVFGPVTPNAPTGGNVVSGTVTISNVAGSTAGPLYVGFVDTNSFTFYFTPVASPTVTSGTITQNYSVNVPNGSNYYFVAIDDMNNDGVLDAGDISNTNNLNTFTPVSGAATGVNLNFSGANASAYVSTQDFKTTPLSGSATDNYSLTFEVFGVAKLPVALALTSGANVLTTTDIGLCTSCGKKFNYSVNLAGVPPTAGGSYSLLVTYGDGTSETLTPTISTPVFSAFATSLVPSGTTYSQGSGTSVTPTFTWTNPSGGSSYNYSFYMNDNNGGTVWQVPGNNSNSNGIPYAVTTMSWISSGNDIVGDANNRPFEGTLNDGGPLTAGTIYSWDIQVQDANGNSTIQQVQYKP